MQTLPVLTLETMAALALANRLHRLRSGAKHWTGVGQAAATAKPKPTSADALMMAGVVLLAATLMTPAILTVAVTAWLYRGLSWRH